jgi:hypothetical protein
MLMMCVTVTLERTGEEGAFFVGEATFVEQESLFVGETTFVGEGALFVGEDGP